MAPFQLNLIVKYRRLRPDQVKVPCRDAWGLKPRQSGAKHKYRKLDPAGEADTVHGEDPSWIKQNSTAKH